ncbi:hypothetical protein B0H11DRAFT_2078784 [Mycena galericulata]|nr:hypothetical protein B0H11DRAFT_2078784 [Mycena galericulata]
MLVSHPVERLSFILPVTPLICALLALALKSFPQTAPFAPAFEWASARAMQGAAVIVLVATFHSLVGLVRDARRWLTRGRATSTSSPAELENGTGSPDLSALAAGETTASAGVETDSDSTPDIKKTIPKLVALFSNPAILCIILFSGDVRSGDIRVVSLDRPLLENVGSTLTFLRRGLPVVVVAYLLLGAVEWSSRVLLRGPRDVEVPDASAHEDTAAAEAVWDLEEKAEKA